MSIRQLEEYLRPWTAPNLREGQKLYYFQYDCNYNPREFKRLYPSAEYSGLGWLDNWEWFINDQGEPNIRRTFTADSTAKTDLALLPGMQLPGPLPPLEHRILDSRYYGTFGYLFTLSKEDHDALDRANLATRVKIGANVVVCSRGGRPYYNAIFTYFDCRNTREGDLDMRGQNQSLRNLWGTGTYTLNTVGAPIAYLQHILSVLGGWRLPQEPFSILQKVPGAKVMPGNIEIENDMTAAIPPLTVRPLNKKKNAFSPWDRAIEQIAKERKRKLRGEAPRERIEPVPVLPSPPSQPLGDVFLKRKVPKNNQRDATGLGLSNIHMGAASHSTANRPRKVNGDGNNPQRRSPAKGVTQTQSNVPRTLMNTRNVKLPPAALFSTYGPNPTAYRVSDEAGGFQRGNLILPPPRPRSTQARFSAKSTSDMLNCLASILGGLDDFGSRPPPGMSSAAGSHAFSNTSRFPGNRSSSNMLGAPGDRVSLGMLATSRNHPSSNISRGFGGRSSSNVSGMPENRQSPNIPGAVGHPFTNTPGVSGIPPSQSTSVTPSNGSSSNVSRAGGNRPPYNIYESSKHQFPVIPGLLPIVPPDYILPSNTRSPSVVSSDIPRNSGNRPSPNVSGSSEKRVHLNKEQKSTVMSPDMFGKAFEKAADSRLLDNSSSKVPLPDTIASPNTSTSPDVSGSAMNHQSVKVPRSSTSISSPNVPSPNSIKLSDIAIMKALAARNSPSLDFGTPSNRQSSPHIPKPSKDQASSIMSRSKKQDTTTPEKSTSTPTSSRLAIEIPRHSPPGDVLDLETKPRRSSASVSATPVNRQPNVSASVASTPVKPQSRHSASSSLSSLSSTSFAVSDDRSGSAPISTPTESQKQKRQPSQDTRDKGNGKAPEQAAMKNEPASQKKTPGPSFNKSTPASKKSTKGIASGDASEEVAAMTDTPTRQKTTASTSAPKEMKTYGRKSNANLGTSGEAAATTGTPTTQKPVASSSRRAPTTSKQKDSTNVNAGEGTAVTKDTPSNQKAVASTAPKTKKTNTKKADAGKDVGGKSATSPAQSKTQKPAASSSSSPSSLHKRKAAQDAAEAQARKRKKK